MESKMSIQKPARITFSPLVRSSVMYIGAGDFRAEHIEFIQFIIAADTNGHKRREDETEGTVIKRDADTFTVRDANGVDTVVTLTNSTSVRSKGKFLRSGDNYAQTQILGGLNLEVEGRGDGSGHLIADKIRFGDTDMRTAQSINARVNPVEDRVGNNEQKIASVEANAQRLSGQIDELAAVSNAARGGAKAAQDTADSAVAGVNATKRTYFGT